MSPNRHVLDRAEAPALGGVGNSGVYRQLLTASCQEINTDRIDANHIGTSTYDGHFEGYPTTDRALTTTMSNKEHPSGRREEAGGRSGIERHPIAERIMEIVGAAFNVEIGDLYGGRSSMLRILDARRAAVWFLRHHTAMSYPEVVRFMGSSGRGHTTAYARFRSAAAMLDEARGPNPSKRAAWFLDRIEACDAKVREMREEIRAMRAIKRG